MPTTVRYIGTLDPYFEQAVTGRPTRWSLGKSGDVSDANAVLLVATGLFEVYADSVLPFVFNTAGAIVGARNQNGSISPLSSGSSASIRDSLSLTATATGKRQATGPYTAVQFSAATAGNIRIRWTDASGAIAVSNTADTLIAVSATLSSAVSVPSSTPFLEYIRDTAQATDVNLTLSLLS
jgi:hypothetical protein